MFQNCDRWGGNSELLMIGRNFAPMSLCAHRLPQSRAMFMFTPRRATAQGGAQVRISGLDRVLRDLLRACETKEPGSRLTTSRRATGPGPISNPFGSSPAVRHRHRHPVRSRYTQRILSTGSSSASSAVGWYGAHRRRVLSARRARSATAAALSRQPTRHFEPCLSVNRVTCRSVVHGHVFSTRAPNGAPMMFVSGSSNTTEQPSVAQRALGWEYTPVAESHVV